MKLAFNLLVLGADIDAGHAPQLERLKALGYDAVEVPVFGGTVERYRALGRVLADIGLVAGAAAVATPQANPVSEDAAVRARARLAFAAALKNAPAAEVLEARIAADGKDLKARHLRGVQLLLGGHDEAALAQFLEMLRIDRGFEEGLPRKALIDAFNVISDEDLVGQYRRRMASLLF